MYRKRRCKKIESGKTEQPRAILKIAQALGVEPNWLQSGVGNMESGTALIASPADEGAENDIVIDVLNVHASAGNGATGDLVEVVSRLHYVPEQFNLHFRGINPDNIRIINISGDSMIPTFAPGDMIFVDISTCYFNGDGVYVFNYRGDLYVKRLQKTGDRLLVISDNQTYREWDITEDNYDQLYIQGKVKVHQSQKLNFIG